MDKSILLMECFYNLPNYIFLKDANFVYQACNYNFVKSLGLKHPDDIIGKTDFDMPWDKNFAKIYREEDEEIMRFGTSIFEKEVPMRFLSETKKRTFFINKIPLIINGDTVGILGSYIDITDLKKAQEEAAHAKAKVQAQEEIQKALLTFTGTMSHDLRTPLSSIQVNTIFLEKTLPILVNAYKQLQKSTEDTPALDQHQVSLLEDSYQNIINATIQAESYIDTTLKILKGAATGSELLKPDDLAPCSIEEVLRRVLRNYPFKEAESNKLHSDTLDGFMFMGNSIFMARVLQNLIKNAFEQIRLKGRGEIFIHCEQGKSLNYLKIKDTAGGVTPPLLEHLFDGFNSTKAKGTGLGLSSAKQIMKAFGGDISCYLVDKNFIEFKLSFPKID